MRLTIKMRMALGALALAACASGRGGPRRAAGESDGAARGAPGAADSVTSTELPFTPTGLEQFVAAVPVPADTAGRCAPLAGDSLGQPGLRGLLWTTADPGGVERKLLLLLDAAGDVKHYSDIRVRGEDRTEIAINLGERIGRAANYRGSRETQRVLAPAAPLLAASSLGGATRTARAVLTRCGVSDSR